MYGQSTGDYRSAMTVGDWADASSWERFDGNDWVMASAPPTNLVGTTYIQAGSNITINDSAFVRKLIIMSGGTLTQNNYLSVDEFTLEDALIVDGTWVYNSGKADCKSIVINPTAVLAMSTESVKLFLCHRLTNYGTIYWNEGRIGWGASQSRDSLVNNGDFIISGSINNFPERVFIRSVNEFFFINNGTFTKSGTCNASLGDRIAFYNAGTVECNEGQLKCIDVFFNASNLILNGGSFTNEGGRFFANPGSSITGTGRFEIIEQGDLFFRTDLTLPVGVTLLLDAGGTINVEANKTLSLGNFNWIAGKIQGGGNLVFSEGSTITLSSSAPKQVDNIAHLTNDGRINWEAGDWVFSESGFANNLINNGTFFITASNMLQLNFGILTNNGAIFKEGSSSVTFEDGSLIENQGDIYCNGGVVVVKSSHIIYNRGNVFFNGGTLTNQGSLNQFLNSTISGTGLFNNDGIINFTNSQDWPASISFTNRGSLNIPSNETLTINGAFNWQAGDVSGFGTLLIGNTGILRLEETTGKNFKIATIINNGTINWAEGTMSLFSSCQTITNNGLFNLGVNNANFELPASTFSRTTILNNNGVISKNTNGTYFFQGFGIVNNNPNAVIKGIGTIASGSFEFNNTGIIAPGVSIGRMSFLGPQPLSENSTLNIEINNRNPENGYDRLERTQIANSTLTLAGTLNVTQTGIMANGAYRIIIANNITGNFSAVQLPDYCTLQISANAVDVIRNGPEVGEYRCKQSGDWSVSSTWEKYNGFTWDQSGVPNHNDGKITIGNNYTVTVTSAGVVTADELVLEDFGELDINGRLTLMDGPGTDMYIDLNGGGLTINNGGILSGAGTVVNEGRIALYGQVVTAAKIINNGYTTFMHSYAGCCTSGVWNMTDGLTTGSFDNYDLVIFFRADGGVYNYNVMNGRFHNHAGSDLRVLFNTNFDVNEFLNEGELFVSTQAGNTEPVNCVIKNATDVTHHGQFKSNGRLGKITMNTSGVNTYAADCILDWDVHFASGTHEVYSTHYGSYRTAISATVNFYQPEIYFRGDIEMDGGIFGGPAVKRIGEDFSWWGGTVSGGNLMIDDTARLHLGAGQISLGTLTTTLINNGVTDVSTGYGGCCTEPGFTMTNGIIENNAQFVFNTNGGGGVRNLTFIGGTFNNNSTGTIINNAQASSGFGDNATYLRNNVLTNSGTIINNGVSLNIYPATNPTLTGTVTTAAGSQTRFGITSTTTTFNASSVIDGPGLVIFREGAHQVNSLHYNAGSTQIGEGNSTAEVYFNMPAVNLNTISVSNSVMGGNAVKLLRDDLFIVNSEISGGAITTSDTSSVTFYNINRLKTSFTSNNFTGIYADYGGCCSGGSLDLNNGGSFVNNGLIDLTGYGGIQQMGIDNGNLVNNGTMNFHFTAYGNITRLKPATFTNTGTINHQLGRLEMNAFTIGGIINTTAGAELASAGTLTFNGSLIHNDGNFLAPLNLLTPSSKTIKGNGTFSSTLSANENTTVMPGGAPGNLTIAGNYNQGAAALTIEIGGTTPGTEHDRLVVTGSAVLSGTLNAAQINGFDPQSFTSIDILTASSVTGTFSQVNLPAFWSVKYFSNRVSLVKFFTNVYYRDGDADGFGNIADTIMRYETSAPAGYTTDSTDCNDGNFGVNPAAIEVCNGIDDNCDGYVDTVLMDGLVLYMPLDGTVVDKSKNALNATIVGTVVAGTDRFGNPAGAMVFNGNQNNHIRINDHPLLRPSSITLSAWVYIASQRSPSSFITKSINCFNDSWHFGTEGSSYSTWVSNSTNCGDFVQMTSPYTERVWKHVVYTLDAIDDSRKMYVDGTLVASGVYTSSIPYDGNPVLIGAAIENGALDFPFIGRLDDVMIFNRAITAAEVSKLFTSGSPLTALNTRYYADADGDGFGNPALSQLACSQPSGYVSNNSDCNDNSASAYPGAIEICDGVDNDCDGIIDSVYTVNANFICAVAGEGGAITLTAPAGKVFSVVDFASYGSPNGTCGNFSIGGCHASNSLSIANGLIIGQNTVTIPANNNLFGDPCQGVGKRLYIQARYSDLMPLGQTYYADADGDGFGDPVVSQVSCKAVAGYVLDSTDCDDTRNTVYPGAPELCDGLDNNCDGFTDMNEMSDLTPGLIAYYKLNGNAKDTLGAFDGIANGSVIPAANRLGIENGALNFNGTDGFIDISNNTNIPASGAVSVAAWIRYNNSSANLNWFKKGTNDGYGLYLLNNTVYVITYGRLNWNTGVSLTPGNWFHIAFTFDGVTQRIYKNGILSASTNTGYNTASGFAAIGYNAQCSECGHFNGLIDELKVFNIALSSSEVQQQYNLAPLQSRYFRDADGDGFGNPDDTIEQNCGDAIPAGYVSNSNDCDDANANVNPLVSPGVIIGVPTMCAGSTNTFMATGTPGGTWISRNPEIATVDANGLVTAISNGITKIVYQVNDCTPEGRTDSVFVNVAAQYVWTGAGANADWNNVSNWTSCGVPPPGANVTINDVANKPSLNIDVVVGNLLLPGNASIVLKDRIFTINGAVTGTGTLYSSPASSLVVAGNAGTIRFSIGKDTIKNLTIQPNASATIANLLFVKAGTQPGVITLQQGAVLNANGNLTLLSDINGTARVAQVPVDGSGAALASINGDVVVERFIPKNTYKAWQLLSIPTKGPQTIKQAWQENRAAGVIGLPGYGTRITSVPGTVQNGFDGTSTLTSIQTYNPSNGQLVYLTSTLNPAATTSGYFVFVRGDRSVPAGGNNLAVNATKLRTAGPLYLGNQPPVNSVSANRYFMVGNTYPSAIDFTRLPKTGGVVNTYYLWDPKLNNGVSLGAYQTFSATNGYLPLTPGGSYTGANTTIQSGQAFYATSGSTTGTIQLVEAAKTDGQQANVFRSAPPEAKISLHLLTLVNDTSYMVDAHTVLFDHQYEDKVDGNDAPKMLNPAGSIGSVNEQQLLAIEARSSIKAEDTIWYQLSNLREGSYQLEFNFESLAKPGRTIFLKDQLLDTMINVSDWQEFSYSFSMDAAATSLSSNRFMLLFKQAAKTTQQHGAAIASVRAWPNPVSQSNLDIELKGFVKGDCTIRILSANGYEIQSLHVAAVTGDNHVAIRLPKRMIPGMYIIEIADANGHRFTEKLVKQ